MDNELTIENAIEDDNQIFNPQSGINLLALDALLQKQEEVGIFFAGKNYKTLSETKPEIKKLTRLGAICASEVGKDHIIPFNVGVLRDESLKEMINEETLDQFRRAIYELKRRRVIDTHGTLNVAIACYIKEYTFEKKVIQIAETSIDGDCYSLAIPLDEDRVLQPPILLQSFNVKIYRRPTVNEIQNFRLI